MCPLYLNLLIDSCLGNQSPQACKIYYEEFKIRTDFIVFRDQWKATSCSPALSPVAVNQSNGDENQAETE